MTPSGNCPVSVVILTCNRKQVLLELLEDLRKQTLYGRFEIVVVDNHSQDGTYEAMAATYPEVRCISLSENKGCAGRNIGIRAASGEIVVTLDDDIVFTRPDELERVLDAFKRHPDADAINFKILYHDTKELIPFNWCHPRPFERYSDTTFETDYISEGAVAFRKDLFTTVGFYPEDFFLSHEGYDLAYRILDQRCTIIYSPDVQVCHKISRRQRESWRNAYYDTRNYFWLIVKYYPFGLACRQIAYRLCTTLLFCLQRGQPQWYARAVWHAVKGMPDQIRKRRVLSRTTMARLREIRQYEPGLGYKIRHFMWKTSAMNQRV